MPGREARAARSCTPTMKPARIRSGELLCSCLRRGSEKKPPRIWAAQVAEDVVSWLWFAFEASRRQCRNSHRRVSQPSQQSAWSPVLTGYRIQSIGRRVERIHAAPAVDSCIRHGGLPTSPSYHPISVRTGLVRPECYYILYTKASYALYLDKSRKTDDDRRKPRACPQTNCRQDQEE